MQQKIRCFEIVGNHDVWVYLQRGKQVGVLRMFETPQPKQGGHEPDGRTAQ